MTEHTSDKAWLVPGAEAVILQPYDRGTLRAAPVTIERVLKRDVVLSNGERFSLPHMEKDLGGPWGTTLYLVPPTDPRVAATKEKIRHRRLRSAAINTYEVWRRVRDGSMPASEVASAFQHLADYEHHIQNEKEKTDD
jgi:hypothetical protein